MNDKQDKGAMQVDVTLVRELAALLDDTNLTEIEVEDGDRKIRVARKAGAMAPARRARCSGTSCRARSNRHR